MRVDAYYAVMSERKSCGHSRSNERNQNMEANISVVKLNHDVYMFHSLGATFYLINGEARSAVIDTGITKGVRILPLIRKYTDLPLILVITHAHLDHMYHIDEFETAYMCHDEFQIPDEFLPSMTGGKQEYLTATLDIQDESVIDLGGDSLEVCKVPGHTPGSVVILEKKHNMLFTGDAIGSGYGVYMQVRAAASLERYRESLQHMLKFCSDRGGLMTFYGGHHYQQFQSKLVPLYNPLSIGLLSDLLTLTDKIVNGEIVGRMSSVPMSNEDEIPLYAGFGRAEIEYLESNILEKGERE